MCLAALAHQYASREGIGHRAVIVDHGIRADSAPEARRVEERLRSMGIEADVARVTEPAPASGIQDWARSVRYARLLEAARTHRAALLLGHHRDDQAETVAMRLRRGSGLAGLAGMRGAGLREAVPLLRPLLGVDRDDILDFCKAKDIGFERDPSNRDRRFERVRVRQQLAASDAAVSRDLSRLGGAAGRIDDALIGALRRHGLLPPPRAGGYFRLPVSALALPDETACRLLSCLVMQAVAPSHPPSRAALARLVARLRAGIPSTLGGARFTGFDDGWLVTAEEGRHPLRIAVPAGNSLIFAGTWRVTSPVDAIVRRLGEAGSGAHAPWAESNGWCGLPPLARRSVPVLQTLDGALQYPHLFLHDRSCGRAGQARAEYLPYSLASAG